MKDILRSVILAYGLSYLFVGVVQPDILSSLFEYNVPSVVSYGSMYAIGTIFLLNLLYFDSPEVYFGLGVFETFGFIMCWTGQMTWTTPLNETISLCSMAVLDFIVAIALFGMFFKRVKEEKQE